VVSSGRQVAECLRDAVDLGAAAPRGHLLRRRAAHGVGIVGRREAESQRTCDLLGDKPLELATVRVGAAKQLAGDPHHREVVVGLAGARLPRRPRLLQRAGHQSTPRPGLQLHPDARQDAGAMGQHLPDGDAVLAVPRELGPVLRHGPIQL